VPPRRPCNVVWKHTAKKLKITETTNQEVGTGDGVVEDHVWFEDRWMVASLCDE
jgi:hypothetical protein